MKLPLSSLLLLAGAALPLPATVVYDSVDPGNGSFLTYSGNGIVAAGNQITLDPGNPITSVAIDLYNENSANAITTGVQLTLYGFTGPNTLGSALGQYLLTNLTIPSLTAVLAVFDLSATPVTLPSQIVWTIEFLSPTQPGLGLNYSAGATTGSVDGNFPWWNTGAGLTQQDFSLFGGEIYGAQFTSAVPEPSTWALLGGAGLLLVWRKRR